MAHFKVLSMKSIFIIFILLLVIVHRFDLCHRTVHTRLGLHLFEYPKEFIFGLSFIAAFILWNFSDLTYINLS